MAANDVTFTLSAKNRNFIETFLQVQQAMDKGGVTLDDFGKRGQKASETIAWSFAKTAAGVAGVTSAVDVAGKAMRMLGDEYSRVIDLRRQAEGVYTNYAQGMERAALSSSSPVDFGRHEPAIQAALQAGGVPQEMHGQALMALEHMLSSRGFKASGQEVSDEETIKLFHGLLKLFSRTGDFEGMREMSEGVMDIYRADPTQTVDEIMGRIRLGFAQMRITDMEKFGKHALPGLGALMSEYGPTDPRTGKKSPMDADKAMAIMGAMTYQVQDATGRRTTSSGHTFVQQMRQRWAEMPDFQTGRTPEQFQRFQNLDAWDQMQFIAGQLKGMSERDKKVAQAFRVFLMGRNVTDEADKKLADYLVRTDGFTPGGHLTMDARAEEPVKSLLNPNDSLGTRAQMETARAESAKITAGQARAEAKRLYEVNKYAYQKHTNALIATQGMDVNKLNPERAMRGVTAKTLEALSDIEGDSALGKKVRAFEQAMKSGGSTTDQEIVSIGNLINKRVNSIIGPRPGGSDPAFNTWLQTKYGRQLDDMSPINFQQAWQEYRLEHLSEYEQRRVDAYMGAKRVLRTANPNMPRRHESGMLESIFGTPADAPEWEMDYERIERKRHPVPLAPEEGDQSSLINALKENSRITERSIAAASRLADAIDGAQVDHSTVDVTIDDGRGRATMQSVYGGNPMERLG